MIKIHILLIFICIPLISYAQDSPFKEALLLYEKGAFDEVINLLKDSKLKDRDEQVNIKELLASAYLEKNQIELAKKTYKEILEIQPWHQTKNEELTILRQDLKTERNWSFDIFSTLTFLTNTSISKNFKVENVTEVKETYLNNGIGYGLGINIGKSFLNSTLDLQSGLSFDSRKYEFVGIYNNILNGNNEIDEGGLFIKETQQWLSLPIKVKFNFSPINNQYFIKPNPNQKWFKKIFNFPYITSGINVGYSVKNQIETLTMQFVGPPETIRNENQDIDLLSTKLRNRSNLSFDIAFGLEQIVGRSKNITTTFFELGYHTQLQTMANNSKRYSNEILSEQFYYVDNDFKMGFLYVKFGIRLSNFKTNIPKEQ